MDQYTTKQCVYFMGHIVFAAQLEAKCKELHKTVCGLEEEKYDWEVKIRRQEYELNELTIKVNDIKGKL